MDFTKSLHENLQDKKTPFFVAHRGSCGANIPCNTLLAYKLAVDQGADVIEIDVSKSKDGVFFVFHPGMEKVYLNSKFNISEMTAAEVSQIPILNVDGVETHYRIPTLEEVLSFLKQKTYINVDKFFDGKRGHDSFAGEGLSLELIRRYGIRVSELGDYSMEYDLKTPEQQAEVCNVVRFAINRCQLSREHLDYVISAVSELYKDRESIPNMRIVSGHTLPMRHFHAFLEPYRAE